MSADEHISTIYVTDQDRARDFYANVLGYKVISDRTVNKTFRSIVLSPPGQPEHQIALFACSDAGRGVDSETAEKMRNLVSRSAFSAGIIRTADCYAYCDQLRAHGVTFIAEPGPRDWGVTEAIILDDSGNRLAIMGPLEETS